MINYLNVSATLFSTPIIEQTKKGNDKISFFVLLTGMYNSFPIKVVIFNNTAFLLTSVIDTWKKGDNLRIEGTLDYLSDEIIIVANYITNYTRLLGEEIKQVKGEIISDPVDLDFYLEEENNE